MTKKFFVYGSLMEGYFNYDKYLKGKVISREYARTKGELYHLSNCGYPAMIEGEEYVYGELIELIDYEKSIEVLDALESFHGEGNPINEYNRKIVSVEVLCNKRKELAYAYVYNTKSVEELRANNPYIKDGNWTNFINEQRLIKI